MSGKAEAGVDRTIPVTLVMGFVGQVFAVYELLNPGSFNLFGPEIDFAVFGALGCFFLVAAGIKIYPLLPDGGPINE